LRVKVSEDLSALPFLPGQQQLQRKEREVKSLLKLGTIQLRRH
jgi:hypothetical protein